MPCNDACSFVKRFTTVPRAFVDELFGMMDESTRQTDTVIELGRVAEWLSVRKQGLLDTLRRSYVRDVDFVVRKAPNPNRRKYGNNYNEVLVSPATFKELAMRSSSKNAALVRRYFIQVEDAFLGYREQLLKGMEHDLSELRRNQEPRVPPGREGYVYFIRAQHGMTADAVGKGEVLGKLGKTKQMQPRMDSYNTGRANNVDVLYQAQTDDMDAVESCVKLLCKSKQYRKRKEVYQIDADIMRKVIDHCAEARAEVFRAPGRKRQTGGYFAVFAPTAAP